MNIVNGYTKLFGIIGNPVKHSLSPSMYNYSFKKLQFNGVYLAFELEGSAALPNFISSMRTLNIGGGNVTMPFKKDIIPYLDNLSEDAEIIGAVNTLVNHGGKITGYNTDGAGIVLALKQKNVIVSGKEITIFGGGGAAISIFYALAKEHPSRINVIVRKSSNTADVNNTILKLKNIISDLDISVLYSEELEGLEAAVKRSHILVNATPLGMSPLEDLSPIADSSLINSDHVLVEAVYHPRVTKFLGYGRNAGCTTIDGLDMLLWQAVKAFELFTDGGVLPVEDLARDVFGEIE